MARWTALVLVVSVGCGAARTPASEPQPAKRQATEAKPAKPEAKRGAPVRAVPDRGDHGAEHDREPGAVGSRFRDAELWSKRWDRASRDDWQKPELVIAELRLDGDETVLDLGAGTGYFTVRLARALPRGRVVAADPETSLVEWVRRRAQREGLANVSAVVAKQDEPGAAGPFDVVLMVNSYHHIPGRSAYFRRMAPMLSERGRLVVVDWRMGELPIGPDDPHKISQWQVTRELRAAGYELCRRFDELPLQYVLTFRRSCSASH